MLQAMREREEREGDRLVAGGGSPGVAPLRQRGGVGGVRVSYAAVLLVFVSFFPVASDVSSPAVFVSPSPSFPLFLPVLVDVPSKAGRQLKQKNYCE